MSKSQRRTTPRVAPMASTPAAQRQNDEQADEGALQVEQVTASAELRRLSRMGSAVAELGVALGIAPDRLAEGEALERLEVTTRLGVATCAAIESDRLAGWFALLGDDLTLDLRVEGLDPDAPPITATLHASQEPAQALR